MAWKVISSRLLVPRRKRLALRTLISNPQVWPMGSPIVSALLACARLPTGHTLRVSARLYLLYVTQTYNQVNTAIAHDLKCSVSTVVRLRRALAIPSCVLALAFMGCTFSAEVSAGVEVTTCEPVALTAPTDREACGIDNCGVEHVCSHGERCDRTRGVCECYVEADITAQCGRELVGYWCHNEVGADGMHRDGCTKLSAGKWCCAE